MTSELIAEEKEKTAICHFIVHFNWKQEYQTF